MAAVRSPGGSAARTKLLVSLGVGVVGGACAAVLGAGPAAALIGWDLLALTFCVWVWVVIWPLDPTSTMAHANRDDPGRELADLVLLGAAVASLVAVGAVLVRASHEVGDGRYVQAGLAVASIVLSWLLVHTVFTLKYARLYHRGTVGGIDFNQDELPQYSDFAYLSFTIGMTFQVSDTDIRSTDIRRTALHHALIAFPLGTLIIASAINLVVGLAK